MKLRNNAIASPLALAVLVGSIPAEAMGVAAGSLIENTATATYDEGSGPVMIPSNTVSLRVDELLDVTLTSLNSGPVAARPGTAVLSFEMTNTGNGPEAFSLTANAGIAGNDFDSSVEDIALDTNGNGVYDPGVDQILAAPETTPVLEADANLTIFVIVTVPSRAANGETSAIELLAAAVTGTGAPGAVFGGQGVDGSDAIVGASGAASRVNGSLTVGVTSVDLVKSAVVADPFGGGSAVPGAVITYTITANVSGGGAVSDLVVTDMAPPGTTYVAGTLALDSVGLTDATDTDPGEATSSGIQVNLGTVAGGVSHSVAFDVIID